MLDDIYDIFKNTEREDIRATVVSRYWGDGAHTFQPCYEFLVKKAKVISVILDKENAKDLIKSEIEKNITIENTSIFISMLKKIWKDNISHPPYIE